MSRRSSRKSRIISLRSNSIQSERLSITSDKSKSDLILKSQPFFDLSNAQKDSLKISFQCFDRNCTGFINAEHLRVAIRALGKEPRKEEVARLIAEHDGKQTGKISFDDYLKIMRIVMGEKETTQNISIFFRALNRSKTGMITLEDLRQVNEMLNEEVEEEELQEMLKEADLNHDGAVDANEFHELLKDMSLLGI